MRVPRMFVFFFFLIASCAGTPQLTQPKIKTGPVTQPLPINGKDLLDARTSKPLKLLAELYKKFISVSGHNPSFNKAKEYQECRQLVLELYQQDKSQKIQNQARKILETYLNQLAREKLDYLTSSAPAVIKFTKNALDALEKLKASSDFGCYHTQHVAQFILKVQKELLPEKALFVPFTFGLPELGYSAAGVTAAIGIGSLLKNSRRVRDEPPPLNHELQDEVPNEIAKKPEIIMGVCPAQGSLGCSQHTSSNVYQIMTKIKQTNGAFSGYTFEEKRRFFLQTNFNFKTESEIRQEIRGMNQSSIKYGACQEWEKYPRHLMVQYLNHSVCDNCKHGYVHIKDNDVFCTFIEEEFIIESYLPVLDYLMSQIEENTTFETILEKIASAKRGEDSTEIPPTLYDLLRQDNELKKGANCPYLQGCPFLNAIREFNQGKCLILLTSTKITATISHITTNIFLKNDGHNAGCIINLDSLWPQGSSKIHNYMKKLYSCFVKYKKCIDFIDANKEALFEQFKH